MSHRFMPLSGFLCFLPSSACTRGLSLSFSLPSSIYIYFALFLLMYVVGCIISFLYWAKFVLQIGTFNLLFISEMCDDDSQKKKQDMYRLSWTKDLPPMCPKGTGSTAFPHKPLPKQIWRGSGTLSLLSGVTKFRKHQVYVCVCACF